MAEGCLSPSSSNQPASTFKLLFQQLTNFSTDLSFGKPEMLQVTHFLSSFMYLLCSELVPCLQ